MRQAQADFRTGFHVLTGDLRSQAACMVIPAGGKEGGSDNFHSGADQWLYVVGGKGEAVVNGHTYPLVAGTVMLIQRGDTHEIRNTGRSPLKTMNIYLPPAYTSFGDELPAGRGE